MVNYKLLNKIVFNSIYKSNHWNKSKKFDSNQSYSGPGSVANSIQTNNLILELQKFFKENDIKNILDAPCGDCAWIKKIFETDINYTGIDIVEDLINQNKLTFNSNLNIKFYCEDCGKQYANKCSLAKHINNVHKGIKYKCDQCHK